ncbi:MAG: hypothetical protein M3Z02_11775 [Actinomycetota bacterium]|nr:hypothetical protein [Actinomycetota bacterium]
MSERTDEVRAAALQARDDLVQALVLAKYALAAGDAARASAAVEQALALARAALSEAATVGDGEPIGPGSLIRRTPPPTVP